MAIIQAAVSMMSDPRSLGVMPEIARRAGVGQATLYRHFPDRNALADAVIAYEISRLEACAGDPDHPVAFRDLLREVLRAQVTMRSLVALTHRLDAGTRERHKRRIVTALAGPLRRAQERREVRGDFHARDLELLFGMVEGILQGGEDLVAAQEAACRSIELVLDGLFRCGVPAPGADVRGAVGGVTA
ncbi:TetR/AcrR family transcriptional regulator [Planobispora longispora]|uniref:TetR/AcrR family transcriptional regulator n=1 Tax=Planobispora longispora TaxID=28887 RepID=UPI001945846F|nr:TetR/AcrR family transcriptional regulator [Planobispora longispora]